MSTVWNINWKDRSYRQHYFAFYCSQETYESILISTMYVLNADMIVREWVGAK